MCKFDCGHLYLKSNLPPFLLEFDCVLIAVGFINRDITGLTLHFFYIFRVEHLGNYA